MRGRRDETRDRELPVWVRGLAVGVWFGALVWLERRQALRRSVESKAVRTARNLAIAAVSGLAVQTAERPLALTAARYAARHRVGLAQWRRLPRALELPVALATLDYTLYGWHVLTHAVPRLWLLHKVHHIDRDMDASTALRFHAVDMLVSAPVRAAQVLLAGASPRAFSWWQLLLFVSILFHHSNVRLPIRWERRLAWVIVTPRLHGIHHSVEEAEVNSNWSSGLTLWDWLHGTLRTDVPQGRIRIGVKGYERPEQVTLGRALALPFAEWTAEPDAPAMRSQALGRPSPGSLPA